MHNPESVLVNETKKVLWDFEIQMDYLTSLRRPDLVKINNKKEKERERTYGIVYFAVLVDHRIKINESEKIDKGLGLARELK